MLLIKTDLPEPVAPAINPCGIFWISVTQARPNKSTPSAVVKGDSAVWNSSDPKTSDNKTGLDFLFGISIPTVLLPGIGASIRMSFSANANFKSSLRLVILLTLTPRPKLSSNCVTVGPTVQFETDASTLKAFRVSFSVSAWLKTHSSLWGSFSSIGSGKSESGGNR